MSSSMKDIPIVGPLEEEREDTRHGTIPRYPSCDYCRKREFCTLRNNLLLLVSLWWTRLVTFIKNHIIVQFLTFWCMTCIEELFSPLISKKEC